MNNTVKKYWEKSIHYQEYITDSQNRIDHPKTPQDSEFKHYYELGLHRMDRTLKKLNFEEDLKIKFAEKNFTGKILIITEAWCGDASAAVPVLVSFFQGTNDVKLFLRDSDLTFIDEYLTNGTRSIPKVLILNDNFEVINTWGPRTKYGTELLLKYKNDPENYTKDMFYNDLQLYYSRNRGKDIIEEILELL